MMTSDERVQALWKIQQAKDQDQDLLLAIRVVCQRAGIDQLAELIEIDPDGFDAFVEAFSPDALLDLAYPGYVPPPAPEPIREL